MNNRKKRSFKFLVKPLFFLIALLLAIWFVLWIETVRPSDFGFYKDIFKREEIITKRKNYPLRETGKPLSERELEMAAIAWKYFENNYQPHTGFVNSVDKYTSTTLWDLTSSLMALKAAYEIGVIDSLIFDERLTTALNTLKTIPIYRDKLPNKVYNTITLEMTAYDNRPTRDGVGWSSMDLGRFFTFCTSIIHNYPQYTHYINSIISNWEVHYAIENATLMGIGLSFKDGTELRVQEGKLGYEQYCAKGFQMMGFDVSNALRYTDFINFVRIYGVDIAVDSREVRFHPSYNYILSDPYIFDGLEYGFDVNSIELAYRILKVQEKHYEKTNVLIAVGETHVDKEPHFVYNSVYVNGKKWHCVSEAGDNAEHLKTFSTAVAFGWYYLFDTPYTKLLIEKAKKLYHPELGWYAGVYKETGELNKVHTANVNATVLQSLNYKLNGPLIGR